MTLPVAFIEGIGGPELMVIMFVVLLLFGADKLPELARGMGKAMREVKKATSGVEQEIKRAMEEDPVTPKPLPKPAASVAQQPSATVNTAPPFGAEPPREIAPPFPPSMD